MTGSVQTAGDQFRQGAATSPREALLARTLVELADNLVADFDVVELLTLLADRCVDVLDVAAAGLMLVVARRRAAGRGLVERERMRVLELFELQADEGPCVDCFRAGEADREPSTWRRSTAGGPASGPRRWRPGSGRCTPCPMRLREQTIGALNLYRVDGGQMSDTDVVAAQALADVATIAILQHRAVRDAQLAQRAAQPGPQHPHRHRAGQGRRRRTGRPRHGERLRPPAPPRPQPQPPPVRRRPVGEQQDLGGVVARRVPAPPLSPRMARALGVLVALICCGFVVHALAQQWRLARHAVAGADPLWLGLGLVAAVAGMVVLALLWWAALRVLGADTGWPLTADHVLPRRAGQIRARRPVGAWSDGRRWSRAPASPGRSATGAWSCRCSPATWPAPSSPWRWFPRA